MLKSSASANSQQSEQQITPWGLVFLGFPLPCEGIHTPGVVFFLGKCGPVAGLAAREAPTGVPREEVRMLWRPTRENLLSLKCEAAKTTKPTRTAIPIGF